MVPFSPPPQLPPEGNVPGNDHNASMVGSQAQVDAISIIASNASELWLRQVQEKGNSTSGSVDGAQLTVTVDPEQSFWESAAQEDYLADDNQLGPEISSPLANAAKVFWTKPLREEVLKDRLAAAVIPANCTFLKTKRVEPEIWQNIPPQLRGADNKLQGVADAHAASVAMIIKAAEELTSVMPNKDSPEAAVLKGVMSSLKNAISLAGNASQTLNVVRREMIKPKISQQYVKLTSKVDESADTLFGGALHEKF